jgi:hypothetical protein
MAWGSDTAATQLTGITTEQFFNQVPMLNPRETAHVQVSVDFPGSPTDHAIVAVYTTLDDASEVWDIIPMMEFLIENTTDPNRISSWARSDTGWRAWASGSSPRTFADAAIDLDILPEITEDELEKLGIPLGHRKRLMRAIATLRKAL